MSRTLEIYQLADDSEFQADSPPSDPNAPAPALRNRPQSPKGGTIPYSTQLPAVAALVIETDGDWGL